MSESNFVLKEDLSIRENIEIFKKRNNLFINIDFPQIIATSKSIFANNQSVKHILANIDFLYISNFFSAVKIYINAVFLSEKDLRDIKKNTDTLYLFLSDTAVNNRQITFEYVSDCYMLLSPNIVKVNAVYIAGSYHIDTKTFVDKLLEITHKNESEEHLTAVKVDSIKNKLTEQFNKSKKEQLEQLDKRLTSLHASINDLQNRLDAKIKEQLELENKIATVAAEEFQYSKYIDSLNKITRIRGITDVDVEDTSIINLYTNKLYVNSMGYRFYVGRFRINVNMSDNSVHIYNLDDTCIRTSYWSRGCHHPHVSSTGVPCLGEASSGIIDACKNKRPDIIAIILINYLESVNPNDAAGKYLTNWDVVDENGEVIDFPEECKPCKLCDRFVTESNKNSFHICYICGHNHCEDCMDQVPLTNHSDETESVWICHGCADSMQYCSSCGKIMRSSFTCDNCKETVCEECINLIEGHQYCTECVKNHTTACTHCGQLTLNESHLCNECTDHTCTFCHNIVDKLVEVNSNTKLCAECFRNTGVCIYCGERKPIEELTYNENAGIVYCKNGCSEE